MTERSLEQLFAVFLAHGDEDALAQLLRRSAPALRRLARRLGADADDAEDLIQETIVAAIDGAERFDPARPLLPWLKGILTFRAAKLARGRFRRRRFAEPLPPHEVVPDAGAASPAGSAMAQEFAGDVHAAIARLPHAYRAPLQEYLVHGRTPVEIARQLGEARATVRVQLHRGLQRLRATLARWAGLALALVLGRRATAARGTALALAIGTAALAIALSGAWRLREPSVAPSTAAAAGGDDTNPTDPRLPPHADDRVVRAAADAATVRTDQVAVRMVDAAGHPVPHVGVTFLPDVGGDPVLLRHRVVTGADGIARWSPPGPARVAVTTDRGPACSLLPGAAGAPHRLVLRGGRTVTGRVVDANGRGVGDAQVWLASTTAGPWRGDDVVTTAPDGTFTLVGVVPGSFVAARHASLARSDVQRLADGDEPLALRLGAAGGRAVVHVQDARGQPIAGAVVFVGEAVDATSLQLAQGAAPWRPPPCEGRTSADGTFTSQAFAAGRQPIFVRADGMVACSLCVEIAPGRDTAVTVRPTAGGTIAGILQDERGAPLADGDVVLRTGDPVHSVDVRSDAAGRFTFTGVPNGIVDVAARAGGMLPRVVAVRSLAAAAVELPLVLTPLAPLRGSVRRHDGGPAAGASVRAEWPPSALFDACQLATVAADGTFTFAEAPPGRPRLTVRLPDEPLWRPIDAHGTWRDGAVAVDLPPEFAATAGLRGTLRDEHGQPLAEARLFVRSSEQPWIEVGRSAADGSYCLSPLPAGTWTLVAETTSSSLPTLQRTGLVVAPGEHRREDLQAPPCGRVVVDFVRRDGAPIGDLVATLADRRLQRRCAAASASHFEQVLTPGDYTLAVMGSRVRWLDDVALTITAGTTTELRLELVPAARCTLSLLGLPAPTDDTPLRLRLHDAPRRWSTSFTLTADAPRRLAALLAPGDYVLEHDDADGRRWSGTFACSDDDLAPRAVTVTLAPH